MRLQARLKNAVGKAKGRRNFFCRTVETVVFKSVDSWQLPGTWPKFFFRQTVMDSAKVLDEFAG